MEEFDRIFAEKTAPYIEKFTDFYNQNPSILALETLYSLREQLVKETETDEILLKSRNKSILKSLLNNFGKVKGNKNPSLEQKLNDLIHYMSTDHLGTKDKKLDFNDFENELIELGLNKLPGQVIIDINRVFYLRENISFQKLSRSAISIVCLRIVRKQYPDRLPTDQKPTNQELQNSVGRPLDKNVPQTEIENFVRNILFPNGKKTDSKRFIHTTGKYKDLPNWNQLALKYFDENPEIELNTTFTKRQLTSRIKKAYEVINTSLN